MFLLSSAVLFLLLLFNGVTSQQLVTPSLYIVTGAVPFNGSTATNTSTGCTPSGATLNCFTVSTAKLSNGVTGSVTDSLNNSDFFAFNRYPIGSTGKRIDYATTESVAQIVIYFYNSPTNSIGLPQFTVISTGNNRVSVPYFFSDNNDLSQTDSQIRNVTLYLCSIASPPEINIIFPNTSTIDWFLVSEIELYSGSVISPPNDTVVFKNDDISVVNLGLESANLQSSINLSCTVVNSGSFEWKWLYNNQSLSVMERFNVWIGDATRTTTLNINLLSYNDSGQYTCVVSCGNNGEIMAQRNISVQLSVNLQTASTVITANSSSNVNISCELGGYLSSSTVIIWRNGSAVLNNGGDQHYTIHTSMSTNQGAINSSGLFTYSIISTLTILNAAVSDSNLYSCAVNDPDSRRRNITVNIIDTQLSPTDSSSSTPVVRFSSSVIRISSEVSTTPMTTTHSMTTPPTTPQTDSSMIPIIAGAVGGAVVILIAMNILVILLLYFCLCKKRRQSYDASIKKGMSLRTPLPPEPKYTDIKEKPPTIAPYSETEFISENQFINEGLYTYIDDEDQAPNNNNNTYSNVRQSNSHAFAEYQEIPDKSARPLSSVSPPQLAQASSKICNYKDNPQYASANQLDSSSPTHLNSTDYGGSDFNIYAVPNKVPPPVPDYKGSMFSIDLDPSHFLSQDNLDSTENTSSTDQILPFSSIYENPLPINKTDVLEVTPDNVKVISELGVGQFGKVLLAHTIGLSLLDLGLGSGQTSVSILVAVKVLQSDADDLERESFEKEIKFMSRLKHENIVSILGVCLNRDAFIMMEYMENGDLNQYLQKFTYTRNQVTNMHNHTVDDSTLVYIALQIAGGMRYLASKNYVHRDLATRNCLVGQKFLVKIADFGMSRQLYDNNYYRIRGRAMLPIRWMAKECFYGRFSEKTDVWAYGVVAWEVFTLCQCQPYEDFTDQDVIDNAISGSNKRLLEQPYACLDEVYQVMKKCWISDPERRATFEEIHGLLAQIHAYQ